MISQESSELGTPAFFCHVRDIQLSAKYLNKIFCYQRPPRFPKPRRSFFRGFI
ncbi:Uncharacterized protein dnm_032130 [Desulfonema magnum]|uniref:Uncharacterized protein n=1 Tax=Desulfonema magnum TaxID=45655 RepID=A0A975BL91_9BACT|nr:Uncharacterized protein dnm_032130 [Desulfonema magnum]